jgi:hypothetical protein
MVGICFYHEGYIVVDWKQANVWHQCVGNNGSRGGQ